MTKLEELLQSTKSSAISSSLRELLQKKLKAEERLRRLMIGYRGVVHESASSELRHSEVKVMENYLENLNKEIKDLEKSRDMGR